MPKLQCHHCKQDIDLDLTPDEIYEFNIHMKRGEVVMICMTCYYPDIKEAIGDKEE